jgi:hypothetical protein
VKGLMIIFIKTDKARAKGEDISRSIGSYEKLHLFYYETIKGGLKTKDSNWVLSTFLLLIIMNR